MITIRDLYKSLDGNQIYQGVNLVIPDHDVTVILGKSGVGKSILLKHILGLMLPDSGEIFIDDIDITKMPAFKRRKMRLRFGMVFQHSALLDSLTVEQNVGLGLRKMTDLSENEIHERVEESLRKVDLEGTGHMMPEQLSGGMRKRVAFARAVIMNPGTLLYDEPTTGLDPATGDRISTLISDLSKKSDVTTVVVTHDVVATLKIADNIVFLDKGVIQSELTPEQFLESDHPLVQSFLKTGTPRQVTN